IPFRARAEARWALARALWDANSDRARALELATQARDHYGNIGLERKHALVSQWLVSHSSPMAAEIR
ncbi:hypothetical protein ACLESD_51835, partial [Pyxidicoccus sp. 3LFB2]